MNAPELVALVFALQPLRLPAGREEYPAWWGRASQAALLRVVAERDASLAASLHEEDGPRPYTASTLMGRFAQGHRPQLEEVYRLRWTGLTAAVSAALLDFAAQAREAVLELDGVPFRVVGVTDDETATPWGGRATYAELAERLWPGETVPRQVGMQFTSPVVFRSQGLSQPLPLPGLVFGSLLERWNALAPLVLMEELRRFAELVLAVSRFELRSRPVPLKQGGLRIGAVGEVQYTATRYDRFWLGQVHTLAAFARFAGVGAGTTQGLGQTRAVTNGANERMNE